MNDKRQVIFVLGGPGSGKGTYCAKMVADKGYPHFSAGDLLRAERSSGSELGSTINSYISRGALVPAWITVQLLRNAMEAQKSEVYLIDGFPRNKDNYDTWASMCEDVETKFILNFECPEEELIKRALGRTEGRDDDTINILQTRLKSHREDTCPIIDLYRKEGMVRDIDSNREMDVVYAEILEYLS